MDSNQRIPKESGLQPDAIATMRPTQTKWLRKVELNHMSLPYEGNEETVSPFRNMELLTGIEPATH